MSIESCWPAVRHTFPRSETTWPCSSESPGLSSVTRSRPWSMGSACGPSSSGAR